MDGRLRAARGGARAAALSVPFLASSPAYAHVKWFCAFKVAGQPVVLPQLLCAPFFELLIVSVCLLTVGVIIDRRPEGRLLLRALDIFSYPLLANFDRLFRAVYGGFFVALWAIGGIILTPELTTTDPAISWLQLAMAAGMIWRRTMLFSAGGLLVLYGYALRKYGLFHLLDYPLFLGAAAYMALTATRPAFITIRPLDVLRWAASITLMWASIEKWAYPDWTFPLFVRYPTMSLGFDVRFYMIAAGMVEFSLAFALIGPPLVRRSAAIILSSMFLSAVAGFGKIDAIGHAPIIVVLLAIIADNHRAKQRNPALLPPFFAGAVASVLLAYYGLHTLIFGTKLI